MRTLLVGIPEPFHVGHHLASAATALGWEWQLIDSQRAFSASLWQKVLWRVDRIPCRILAFEQEVLSTAKRFRPELILTTGLAPLRQGVLSELAKLGCCLANFCTDDPWNRHHRSSWFLSALPCYHFVFSPRQSNMADFQSLCAASNTSINLLHFGYNPEVHFIERDVVPGSGCDVLIVGGADSDRVPYAKAMVLAGLKVTAYGGIWERIGLNGLTTPGHADLATLRRATRAAKVNLILVRRANRDGHVMRSYEAWASGGCLLVEDTSDHQEMFDLEGKSVLTFRSPTEAASQAVRMTSSPELRQALMAHLDNKSLLAQHTYTQRLRTIERTIQMQLRVPATLSTNQVKGD